MGFGAWALKVTYSGAIEPIRGTGMGENLNKTNSLRKYQRVQIMMNIKIAKAFGTLI
jgi:hypothetical protein